VKKQSDRYLRMYEPLLQELRRIGGAGTPKEVIPAVIDFFDFSETELQETTKSGALKVENEVRWAVAYLKEFGFLKSDTPGVWNLTEEGWKVQMSIELGRALRKDWQKNKKKNKSSAEIIEELDDPEDLPDERKSVLQVLQELPPEGFERFCQQLLRHVGFQAVVVTGKSGDGGIDGNGVFQMNQLISIKVLFQCKRYQGAVSPSDVRDFRGAMQGRTEMGIFLTTGSFSKQAKEEAARDGVPTIQLVDGSRLKELIEERNFGVRPRTEYDVDEKFFDQFRI
jgi:restriction system protein